MSEYKRLTERTKHGIAVLDSGERFVLSCGGYATTKALKRLAELEDKIANGTLIELPCKVGDTVYCVEYFCNYKGCSSDEQMFCCGCPEMIERERRKETFVISKKKFRLQDLDRVGKTLFPTEEAAEARLKELQEVKK